MLPSYNVSLLNSDTSFFTPNFSVRFWMSVFLSVTHLLSHHLNTAKVTLGRLSSYIWCEWLNLICFANMFNEFFSGMVESNLHRKMKKDHFLIWNTIYYSPSLPGRHVNPSNNILGRRLMKWTWNIIRHLGALPLFFSKRILWLIDGVFGLIMSHAFIFLFLFPCPWLKKSFGAFGLSTKSTWPLNTCRVVV